MPGCRAGKANTGKIRSTGTGASTRQTIARPSRVIAEQRTPVRALGRQAATLGVGEPARTGVAQMVLGEAGVGREPIGSDHDSLPID